MHTLWNQAGHWVNVSRNILKHPLSSTSTASQWDTPYIQNNSTLYTRKFTVIPGPLKKLCSSASMTQHSIGTWASTSCHTCGNIFYSHHQPYSSSLPAFPHTPPNHNLSHNPPTTHTVGIIQFFLGKYQMPAHKTPPNPPNPSKYFPLQQHHLGKFSIFIC